MDGISTVGQAISDRTGKAIDDIKAQLFARKSASMKLAHAKNPNWIKTDRKDSVEIVPPKKNRYTKNRKGYKWKYYARKKLSKALIKAHKEHPESWNGNKKQLTGINPLMIGHAENSSLSNNLTLMNMVADRIAEKLLERMK